MVQNNAINHVDLVLHKTVAADIDFKTTGVTTIFTTPAGLAFIPMGWGIYATSFSGAITAPTYNLGTNAATYDNFTDGCIIFPFNNTNTASITTTSEASANTGDYIPAGTDFKINITGAATGTTVTGRIFIYGFYVPDN